MYVCMYVCMCVSIVYEVGSASWPSFHHVSLGNPQLAMMAFGVYIKSTTNWRWCVLGSVCWAVCAGQCVLGSVCWAVCDGQTQPPTYSGEGSVWYSELQVA